MLQSLVGVENRAQVFLLLSQVLCEARRILASTQAGRARTVRIGLRQQWRTFVALQSSLRIQRQAVHTMFLLSRPTANLRLTLNHLSTQLFIHAVDHLCLRTWTNRAGKTPFLWTIARSTYRGLHRRRSDGSHPNRQFEGGGRERWKPENKTI